MKNFVCSTEVVNIEATEKVTSGQIFLLGSLVVVANNDAEIGDRLAVTTTGVLNFKVIGACTAGQLLYYHAAKKEIDTSPNLGVAIGVALDAGNNQEVRVFLSPLVAIK